ncbi:hypothetical protein GW17_00008915, partial [Ensete ventricosum]
PWRLPRAPIRREGSHSSPLLLRRLLFLTCGFVDTADRFALVPRNPMKVAASGAIPMGLTPANPSPSPKVNAASRFLDLRTLRQGSQRYCKEFSAFRRVNIWIPVKDFCLGALFDICINKPLGVKRCQEGGPRTNILRDGYVPPVLGSMPKYNKP